MCKRELTAMDCEETLKESSSPPATQEGRGTDMLVGRLVRCGGLRTS